MDAPIIQQDSSSPQIPFAEELNTAQEESYLLAMRTAALTRALVRITRAMLDYQAEVEGSHE